MFLAVNNILVSEFICRFCLTLHQRSLVIYVGWQMFSPVSIKAGGLEYNCGFSENLQIRCMLLLQTIISVGGGSVNQISDS